MSFDSPPIAEGLRPRVPEHGKLSSYDSRSTDVVYHSVRREDWRRLLQLVDIDPAVLELYGVKTGDHDVQRSGAGHREEALSGEVEGVGVGRLRPDLLGEDFPHGSFLAVPQVDRQTPRPLESRRDVMRSEVSLVDRDRVRLSLLLSATIILCYSLLLAATADCCVS